MISVEALLLADPSPTLRYRVLRELLAVPDDDPEVVDLRARAAESRRALSTQAHRDLRSLFWCLCQLALLGGDRYDPYVMNIANMVFSYQLADGSFPLAPFGAASRYDSIPLQTALPLRGLAAVGLAQDPRAERAYTWLLEQRLPDGSWPTGRAHGQLGYRAEYRKLPGSQGCRSNTTGALACLVLHPRLARGDETREALDLLLQRQTRDQWAFGSEVARLAGAEPAVGFVTFYALFDLAFVMSLAAGAGASLEDARVKSLVDDVHQQRQPFGLWIHPRHANLSRWLTFDILLSLKALEGGDWVGQAPVLPLRATGVRRRRRF